MHDPVRAEAKCCHDLLASRSRNSEDQIRILNQPASPLVELREIRLGAFYPIQNSGVEKAHHRWRLVIGSAERGYDIVLPSFKYRREVNDIRPEISQKVLTQTF